MCYQLDSAVLHLGTVIENALQEREEVGIGKDKEWQNKYTLAQLLKPEFRLPYPDTGIGKPKNITIQEAAGDSKNGIKTWNAMPADLSFNFNDIVGKALADSSG